MDKDRLTLEILVEAQNINDVKEELRKYAKKLRRAADSILGFLEGEVGIDALKKHFEKTGNDMCAPHAVVPGEVDVDDMCPDPVEYAEYINDAPERFKRIIEGK